MPRLVPILIVSSKPGAVWRDTLEALAAARRFRLHAIVLSDTIPPRSRHLASIHHLPVDVSDDECLATIEHVARQQATQALLPVWNREIALVSAHRDRLQPARPVPVPDAPLLPQFVDKHHFAQLMRSHGLASPTSLAIEPGDDPALVAEQVGFPMLLRPRISEAGSGIQRIDHRDALSSALSTTAPAMIAQQWVPGEDLSLTLLADRGQVFSVMVKKRWLSRPGANPYLPPCDWDYLQAPWIEQLGRRLVEATAFSGIADFDLRVDFATQRAWFLECDPRIMGSVSPNRLFGVNVPQLLVDHALHGHPPDFCARNRDGHFLSIGSVLHWLRSGAWRQARRGPVLTNWRSVVSDPWSRVVP